MQTEGRTRHLVAQEPFFYDGRTLEVGERFSATPQHAMILEGLSKARADDEDEPVQASSAVKAAEDENPTPEIDRSGTSEDADRAERNRRRRERRVLHTSKAD